MKAKELFIKATTAAASEKILLNADDFDGACNRAYYAMFDAARGALLASGEVDSVEHTKTHSGLISVFSLKLVKTGQVSIEFGKALNRVEDLRLMGDYKGDLVAKEDAQWAVAKASEFVEHLLGLFDKS